MDKMIDHACDEETEKQIYDCVMENENVLGIDLLQRADKGEIPLLSAPQEALDESADRFPISGLFIFYVQRFCLPCICYSG